MKKKICFFIFLFLIGISGALATQTSIGNIKIGDDVPVIQLCPDCTYNNITSIVAPNGSTILSQTAMSQTGTEYGYTLDSSNAQLFGEYRVNGFGDLNGTDTVWSYSFFITPNGEGLKGENFSIFLYLAFTLILFACVYVSIINVAKIAARSETIFGLAFSWAIYFGLLIMYWLISNYSTSSFLRSSMVWVIPSFGLAIFFLPLISLFLSIFTRSMEKKQPLTIPELTGRRFAGYG